MAHTAAAVRPVEASISRSWLLVNAARPESFVDAAASQADQVVLDIEDAVDPSSKCAARATVADWLESGSAWVRINDRTTGFWSHDLDLPRLGRAQKIVALATAFDTHP